jgi:hypothetical protein
MQLIGFLFAFPVAIVGMPVVFVNDQMDLGFWNKEKYRDEFLVFFQAGCLTLSVAAVIIGLWFYLQSVL